VQNLGVGEAVARIERAESDFNLRTAPVPRCQETPPHNGGERFLLHQDRTGYLRSFYHIKGILTKVHQPATFSVYIAVLF
jgi:hypothetical protein